MNAIANQDEQAAGAAALVRVGIALFVLVAACGIYASFERGIWLDEFWSLRLGDPAVAITRLVEERWLRDTNPVWANLLYRLAAGSSADDVARLRLILNLPAYAFLLAATLRFTRTSPVQDPYYLVFAMLVVALPAFVATLSDFRSYHWQVCAAAVLLQYAYRVVVDVPDDRSISMLGLSALFIALTLHFVSGLLVSVLVGLLLLVVARSKAWPSLAAMIIAAGLAWLSMLALFAVQYRRISRDADVSWITTSTVEAVTIMAATLSAALLANPAAAALALLARGDAAALSSRRNVFVLMLVASIVGGAAILLAINLRQPIVIDRYLLPWQVMMCAIVAAFGARRIAAGGWRLYAVTGVAALSVAFTTARQAREIGWDGTRDFIADEVRRCPATRVYAINPWRLRNSRGSRAAALERPVFDDAYRKLARNAGFSVTILPDEQRVLDLSAVCPTLLWIEHSGGRRLGDGASLLRAAGLGFPQRARVGRFATADGLVVIARRAR